MTGLISIESLVTISMMLQWKSSQWLRKNIVRNAAEKKLRKSMDKFTVRRDSAHNLSISPPIYICGHTCIWFTFKSFDKAMGERNTILSAYTKYRHLG